MIAIFFALIGTFYMFGGYVVIRAIAMDALIDKAIKDIEVTQTTSDRDITDRYKSRFLATMALVSFTGGAFVFFQSALALVLFCISLVMQVLYLTVLAPKYFDTDEDDELAASGRRATVNAMMIYCCVTLILATVQYFGVVPSFQSIWSQRETGGLVFTLAFTVYALWILWPDKLSSTFDPDHTKRGEDSRLRELRVQAADHEEGLWGRYEDEGSWHILATDEIGLSADLRLKVSEWEDRYDTFWEVDPMSDTPLWTDADKQAHFAEAFEIAQLLKREATAALPDAVKVTWVNDEGDILDV